MTETTGVEQRKNFNIDGIYYDVSMDATWELICNLDEKLYHDNIRVLYQDELAVYNVTYNGENVLLTDDIIDGATYVLKLKSESAAIRYEGKTIATLSPGESVEIPCKRTVMKSNLLIKSTSEAIYETISETAIGYGSIQLEDVSSHEHTLNIKLENKNLIQNEGGDFSTYTTNGVTFEHLGDGVYHVYGTATVQANLYINKANINPLKLKEGVTYTTSGGASQKVGVSVYSQDWTEMYTNIKDGGSTFNIKDENLPFGFYLYVPAGYEVDEMVYPMLEIGDTATGFSSWRDLSGVNLRVMRYKEDEIYSEEFYPNADGIVDGVTSLFSPRMYLMIDYSDIKITVKYNIEPEITIANLKNRIAELEALIT